jgi:hypothetical protein
MGPEEMEQMIKFEPFVPFRLTLSSGDKVDIMSPMGLNIIGLSLAISDVDVGGQPTLRFISLPNIAIAQPLPMNRYDAGGER